MTDIHRPITSKARGICKYYTTDRGCFNAKSCKFLHTSEPVVDPSGSRPPALTPFDTAKRCRYYDAGYCKRGGKCWFIHEKAVASSQAVDDDDEELCSVCFEKPSLYGLLGGCNHIFCIDCIRKWRDPVGKGNDISNIKKCPMCRAKCRYIIPSSRFCKDGPEKEKIVQNHKDSMAKIPCKHFAAAKAKDPRKPMCPFGKDCFYQHVNADGTPHIFTEGAEISLQRWARRNSRGFSFLSHGLRSLPNEDGANIAGSIAIEFFDRIMADAIQTAEMRAMDHDGPTARTRRRFLDRGLDRASMEMMNDAVYALGSQIQRANVSAAQDGGNAPAGTTRMRGAAGPFVNWDLDVDADGVDNGWGWNDLVADAAHNADIDLTERLVSLADNMLGSSRFVRGRDTESPPPPLEPITNTRQDTPPPPLEPIGHQDDDDDEMPALQSVSNSSDSGLSSDDDGNEEMDRYSDYNPHNDMPPLEAIRLTRPRPRTEVAYFSEARLFGNVIEMDEMPAFPPRPISATAAGSQQRSPFEQHEQRDAVSGASSSQVPQAPEPENLTVTEISAQAESNTVSSPELTPEPPFVTDGRGRVVWSNKDSTDPATPSEPREETPTDDDQAAPSNRSRLFEWMTGFF